MARRRRKGSSPAGIGLRIGVAARQLGVSTSAIRRAEARGLIKIPRTASGRRVIDATMIRELRAILPVARDLVVR